MKYPGYVILIDGELLDCGDGMDNTIVYGPDDNQDCIDRAVAVLGLDEVQEVTIKKVKIVDRTIIKSKKEIENG